MRYIDSKKLIAEIEQQIKNFSIMHNTAASKEDYESMSRVDCVIARLRSVLAFVNSLQQEQPDYKDAVQLVFEEGLIPFKDGNQWCFLLGRNIQEGICGFGDTILDAAVAFYNDYTNTRIHIGELKISMAQQEQPEVELEKEIKRFLSNTTKMNKGEWRGKYPISDIGFRAVARHFYELGLNARKEK